MRPLGPADLGFLELLCRAQLAAQRRGCRIRVVDADADLLDLLGLVGLTDLLVDPAPGSRARRSP